MDLNWEAFEERQAARRKREEEAAAADVETEEQRIERERQGYLKRTGRTEMKPEFHSGKGPRLVNQG